MDKLRKQLMLFSDDLKHEAAKLFQQHKSQALQHNLCHGAWLFYSYLSFLLVLRSL